MAEILDVLKDKNSAVVQVGTIFCWRGTKYKVTHIEERQNENTEETHLLLKVKEVNI